MQEYYNKYQWGGRFVTKLLGTGLRNARNWLDDPKVLTRLNGLSRSFKGVDDTFSKLLLDLKDTVKQGRLNGKASNYEQAVKKLKDILKYFNNLKKLPANPKNTATNTTKYLPMLQTASQSANKAAEAAANTSAQTATNAAAKLSALSASGHYLSGYRIAPNARANRMLNARARREQALAAATQAAANQQALAASTLAATTQAKKATVGSWFKGVGNWLNEHPAITVPAMLIGSGTGIGRWAVGNGIKASLWSPDGGDSNSSQGDFILMPDGKKYQIRRGADGNFLFVTGNSAPTDSADNAADDSAIDAAIDAATNNAAADSTAAANPNNMSDPSLLPLDTINEIFGALL